MRWLPAVPEDLRTAIVSDWRGLAYRSEVDVFQVPSGIERLIDLVHPTPDSKCPEGGAARTRHPEGRKLAVAILERATRYRRPMDIPDTPAPHGRPDPTKLAPTFGHLLLPDTRNPEEQRAASLRESARRKGRGRGNWWKKG